MTFLDARTQCHCLVLFPFTTSCLLFCVFLAAYFLQAAAGWVLDSVSVSFSDLTSTWLTTLQLHSHSRDMSTDCVLLVHFPFDCSPQFPSFFWFVPLLATSKQMAKKQTRMKAKTAATYNVICYRLRYVTHGMLQHVPSRYPSLCFHQFRVTALRIHIRPYLWLQLLLASMDSTHVYPLAVYVRVKSLTCAWFGLVWSSSWSWSMPWYWSWLWALVLPQRIFLLPLRHHVHNPVIIYNYKWNLSLHPGPRLLAFLGQVPPSPSQIIDMFSVCKKLNDSVYDFVIAFSHSFLDGVLAYLCVFLI